MNKFDTKKLTDLINRLDQKKTKTWLPRKAWKAKYLSENPEVIDEIRKAEALKKKQLNSKYFRRW